MRATPGIPEQVTPSDAIVVAQFAGLAGLLWPGRGRWRLPGPLRRIAAGIVLIGGALSALGLLRLGKDLTVRVEPRPEAPLRTGGPYALSRNPVYAGLLLSSAGFAVLRRRREPLVALASLAGILHVKALLEEYQLRKRFGEEYEVYAAKVPRLVGLSRVARAVCRFTPTPKSHGADRTCD
jgi:protein-S-isoprenylcysteine O-methyltransferase Ste14